MNIYRGNSCGCSRGCGCGAGCGGNCGCSGGWRPPPLQNFVFGKIDASTGLPLAGAQFTLVDRWCRSQTAVSDADGMVAFYLCPCNSYTLMETAAPPGYIANPLTYTVILDECGNPFVNGAYSPAFTVRNIPTGGQGAFIAIKRNLLTGAPLGGALFTLFQGTQMIASNLSVPDGTLFFVNLAPGSYELVESNPPPGFQGAAASYSVLVQADGSVTINGLPANGFTLYNIPSFRFAFRKLDAATQGPLAGATFSLSGGMLPPGKIAFSNQNGLVDFGTLPVGVYEMREVVPPYGYAPNPVVYQVMVDPSGTILVNGIALAAFSVSNIAM